MTLEQLEIFKAVIKEGSFRAAADKLWKTQPAISIAIKKLEKEFGLTFFDRDNYRATLTPEGRSFYEKCRVVLQETDQLKALGKHLASGEEPYLKISINIVSPLPVILSFLKSFFDFIILLTKFISSLNISDLLANSSKNLFCQP